MLSYCYIVVCSVSYQGKYLHQQIENPNQVSSRRCASERANEARRDARTTTEMVVRLRPVPALVSAALLPPSIPSGRSVPIPTWSPRCTCRNKLGLPCGCGEGGWEGRASAEGLQLEHGCCVSRNCPRDRISFIKNSCSPEYLGKIGNTSSSVNKLHFWNEE